VTKATMWQYYEQLPKWKARCKFCSNKHSYIDISRQITHIQRKHEEIFEHEIIRQEWPWIYFKCMYNDTSNVRICLICNVKILSNIESVEKHLRNHSKKEMEDYEFLSWVWKYYIKTGSFIARCDLCPTRYIISTIYLVAINKSLNNITLLKTH